MKNRKILVAVIIILICAFLGQYAYKIVTYDREDENVHDLDFNIQDLTMVPQCLWGTWVMTAELHGQYGWGECRNDLQGLSVRFTPTSFTFQNDHRKVSSYSCEIIAIADVDGYFREAGKFRDFGLKGDYFLKLSPEWDNWEDRVGWLWEYILVSETELVIPDARSGMYRMEKIEGYTETEDESDYLEIIPYQSICYGIWEVTEELGKPCQFVDIGYKLGTFGKSGSFDYCRVLDRNEKTVDEIAELIGLSDGNEYLVYCKFSADCFWDYMIIKDGMTAVLVKGECLYQVRRISDPEKDSIFYELGDRKSVV